MPRNPLTVLAITVCLLTFFIGAQGATHLSSGLVPFFKLMPVVTTGLDHPLFLTHAGDGTDGLYILEQPGRIRVVKDGRLRTKPFLDVTDRVRSGGEQGLLGLAFHPDYRRNGRLFINYNRKSDGATVVAEYHRQGDTEASSEERIVMIVAQPYANHNGGMVTFGPDGYLYIGRGDGGSRGDPDNRAQDPNDLLGKILRIDVDHGAPYGIPPDNPFAKGGGRGEIYAWGLRNPWRFSFDPATKALWVADVGQYKWEEIDRVTRGGNYGWRRMEGTHCFNPSVNCAAPQLIPPVFEYGHEGGRCSVIGGAVYRGGLMPTLVGTYVYGDFCSGEIFGFKPGIGQREPTVLLNTGFRISSFGVDQANEMYVLDHAGNVYRLEPAEPS